MAINADYNQQLPQAGYVENESADNAENMQIQEVIVIPEAQALPQTDENSIVQTNFEEDAITVIPDEAAGTWENVQDEFVAEESNDNSPIILEIVEDNNNSVQKNTNEDEAIIVISGADSDIKTAENKKNDTNGNEPMLAESQYSDCTCSSIIAPNRASYFFTDASGNLVKSTDIQTIENGYTTINVYNNGSTEPSLTAEGFKFVTPSNETKFKFATGQEYTMDFKTEGNDVNAEISRGSLKANYNIFKNSNGSYTMGDKTYTSIEEIAAELNTVEIPRNYAMDGVFGPTYQGNGSNDCGLLSGMNAMDYTERGSQYLNNALQYNEDGSLTLFSPALNGRVYTGRPENGLAEGDLEMSAFEDIVRQIVTDEIYGNIGLSYDAPVQITNPDKTSSNLLEATYSEKVFNLITGLDFEKNEFADPYEMHERLLRFMENKDMAFVVATNLQTECYVKKSPDSEYATIPAVLRYDAFGRETGFPKAHANAVKDVNMLPSGELVITSVNPWASDTETVMTEGEFLATFDTTYTMYYDGKDPILGNPPGYTQYYY